MLMRHFRVTVDGHAAITSAQTLRKKEGNTPLLAKLIAELEECHRSEGLLVEDIERFTTQVATWDRYVGNIGVVSEIKLSLMTPSSPFPLRLGST